MIGAFLSVSCIALVGVLLAGFKLPKGVLAMFGCVIMPGGGILVALLSGLTFDGTVTLSSILTVVGMIGGGFMLISQVPDIKRAAVQNTANTIQIANDLTRVAAILSGMEGRMDRAEGSIDRVEGRLDDHINNHKSRGAHG